MLYFSSELLFEELHLMEKEEQLTAKIQHFYQGMEKVTLMANDKNAIRR